MDEDLYEDIIDVDEEEEEDDEAYGEDEIDEMLGELAEAAEEDDDLAERRRRRRGRRKSRGRRPVRTAKGKSAYRQPAMRGYVTQKQFKDALGRVGADVRRNATGIKTVNSRVGKLDGRVNDVVAVNRVQSKAISKVEKMIKIDGALDFAQSFTAATDSTSGTVTLTPNFSNLFKGAIKSGMLGDMKGALSNPAVVGGLAFLLTNTNILGGILGGKE
jgi:hypothetical protein